MDWTLNEALNEQSSEDLKRWAKRFLPFRLVSTRKADVIRDIERCLLTDDGLSYVWNHLTDLEKEVVRETVHDDRPVFNERRFKWKHGMAPPGISTANRYTTYITYLNMILYGERYSKPDTIPVELVEKLKQFVEPPEPVILNSIESLPETVQLPDGSQQPLMVRSMERIAVHELKIMLRLIENESLAVSAKAKKPTVTTLRRFKEQLIDGDYYELRDAGIVSGQVVGPIRGFAWPMILQAARLVNVSNGKLKMTKSGLAAISEPPEVAIRYIWNHWLAHSTFDEFGRIDSIKGQQRRRGSYRALTEASNRRKIVELALKECVVGKWVSFSDLSDHLRAIGLEVAVALIPWLLYVLDDSNGPLDNDLDHLREIVDEPYLLCLLFEYAATLGLIDLAFTNPDNVRNAHHSYWGGEDLSFFSAYDGLQFIRLTPLGEFCLGLSDSYEPSDATIKTPIRLLPDLRFEVVAGTFSIDERLFVESFADSESDSLWRLDMAKSVEALENDHTTDDLRAFLTDRDEQPMPEKTEGFLRNIETRSQAIEKLGETILYEFKDNEVAKRIATDKETRKYCHFAYENVLGISTSSEKKFQDAVHRIGYGIQRK